MLDDDKYTNMVNLCNGFLTSALDSKIEVHIIRAMTLKSLSSWCIYNFEEAVDLVDQIDKIYIFDEHSDKLVHIYGADRGLIQYGFGALASVMIGDFKKALKFYNQVQEHLYSLNHIQSLVCCFTVQWITCHFLQMYSDAAIHFAAYLDRLVTQHGAHYNMFSHANKFFLELSQRLQKENNTPPSTRPQNINTVLQDTKSKNAKTIFDYNQLLIDSHTVSNTIELSKNTVNMILGVRYGKSLELVKAELCLTEAKRINKFLFHPHSNESTRGAVKEYCDAGIRFIDFCLVYYTVDGDINTLQCLTTKAEILVLLSSITIIHSDSVAFMNDIIEVECKDRDRFYEKEKEKEKEKEEKIDSNKMIINAKNCLDSALELGLKHRFEIAALVVGMHLVQLDLDIKKGKDLIIEFLLGVYNQGKIIKEEKITNVYTVINNLDDEYKWINDIPILCVAISLLHDK